MAVKPIDPIVTQTLKPETKKTEPVAPQRAVPQKEKVAPPPAGPSRASAENFARKVAGSTGFRSGSVLARQAPTSAKFAFHGQQVTGSEAFGRIEEYGDSVKNLPLAVYDQLLQGA